MVKKKLNDFSDWVSWLQGNLERKCDPSVLRSTLIENQFSEDSIDQQIAIFENQLLLEPKDALKVIDLVDYRQIANPKLVQSDNGLNALKVQTNKLQLYLIEDFLSDSECTEIITTGEKQLRPSTLTLDDIEKSYRTSQTCDLGLLENPFIEAIDNKIFNALGIGEEFSEVTQLQKYEVGQEFKKHTDYFKPNTKEFEMNGLEYGNRTWTFMIYLNDVPEGGGTHFYAINKTIIPKRGMAVAWNSLYEDGAVNPDTLHAGLPIEEGQKYVITKWFRERANKVTSPPQDPTEDQFAKGNLLLGENKHQMAIDCFNKAISIKPDHPAAFYNRGNALLGLSRFDDAINSFDQCISFNPKSAEAYFNRGIAQVALKQFASAIHSFDRAIEIKPNYSGAFNNRGLAQQSLLHLKDAVSSFDMAVNLDPKLFGARLNLSLCLLLSGDFKRGWKEFECRWDEGGYCNLENRDFSIPRWDGKESLKNKMIFLYGEQGFGDAIQFSRYIPLVAQLGAKVIVEAPASLLELFSNIEGISKIIKRGDAVPNCDFHYPLLSLPHALSTDLLNIPFPQGYLRADKQKITHWKKKIGKKNKPLIGLVWSGNAGHHNDQNRSIALENFISVLGPEYGFVCLQNEIKETELPTLLAHPEIQYFGSEIKDFDDTAAICSLMDLVISVDTSVAHLAGALGKPTWLLLPQLPDWRWLLGREDSPWYESMKLYRQKTFGSWSDTLAEVKTDLLAI
ncbi:tetratricopeptide repeat protein [Polynucleobacter sp. Latsch14-2]|jgi:tetratricopeptide (TPR) repeat protein|uniref:tetratricopeptide repeat protein n=1 Tax=Polynucleobacter sp. Latsch14-2 TaxID=2576920 RepID=UPI001C0C8DE1|nr:tetratricopeptide repeat protein [Polynucleobacter sp. Latsch14-2]MBU3614812.1 tetratricopeptide repeat protein [Polynucleobacter sp. Latsch14-2]